MKLDKFVAFRFKATSPWWFPVQQRIEEYKQLHAAMMHSMAELKTITCPTSRHGHKRNIKRCQIGMSVIWDYVKAAAKYNADGVSPETAKRIERAALKYFERQIWQGNRSPDAKLRMPDSFFDRIKAE